MHTFAVYYFTITLMLEIKDITFSYGRHRPPVLNDFSANIRDGGIYGLLGRNGAGKSTLLYLAAGLLTPAERTRVLQRHGHALPPPLDPVGHIHRARRILATEHQTQGVSAAQLTVLSQLQP